MNQKWEWTKVQGLFAKKWHHFALEGSIHKSVNVSNTSSNYIKPNAMILLDVLKCCRLIKENVTKKALQLQNAMTIIT